MKVFDFDKSINDGESLVDFFCIPLNYLLLCSDNFIFCKLKLIFIGNNYILKKFNKKLWKLFNISYFVLKTMV